MVLFCNKNLPIIVSPIEKNVTEKLAIEKMVVTVLSLKNWSADEKFLIVFVRRDTLEKSKVIE